MTNQEAIELLKIERDHMVPTLLPERIEAMDMAISALQEKDSLIARLKAEAIKRNVQYMKSGDRYLIGFVDGMRLARSIVDGSIDEPKYVYPSEGASDDSTRKRPH
jgi:hypothetical protein